MQSGSNQQDKQELKKPTKSGHFHHGKIRIDHKETGDTLLLLGHSDITQVGCLC